MSDSENQTSLAKEIMRLVALAHVNDEVVDNEDLAMQIRAKFPNTNLDELTDQIAMEVISRGVGCSYLGARRT